MSAGEQEGVPELLRAARAVYHPSVGAGGGLGSWGGQEAGSEMTGGGSGGSSGTYLCLRWCARSHMSTRACAHERCTLCAPCRRRVVGLGGGWAAEVRRR